MNLENISIIAWIQKHGIKTEKGDPLSFRDHMFLYDIYRDFSPLQVIMKPAQIGASTMMNVKPFWMMQNIGVDIIYTLPADSDVVDFVSSKTNRIIAQNPVMAALTADRDTIEQKQVSKAIIYYRGTWTKKAAMMIPADVLIHDELDASKQDIVGDYETRVKHSKFKWRWYFSHPSTEGAGVHKYWLKSDQKHWFITCPSCSKKQYLSWPDSIDPIRGVYQCKACQAEIDDNTRRRGEWVKKYNDREFSGYWISSMMCPWVTAKEILKNFEEKDPDYFYTKVLGLPYVGGGNKVTEDILTRNLVDEIHPQDGRIVIGVDTGAKIHTVVGNKNGIFYYSETDGYEELEYLLSKRFPRSIAVIDQGGDLIKPRELRQKYPGRVFLCHFRQDRKTLELCKWGEGREFGNVIVDRNRMIQLVVDEFTDKRLPIYGKKPDWEAYMGHWFNMYRVGEEDALGITRREWKRSGADHWSLATVYMRVGLSKYGEGDSATILGSNLMEGIPIGPEVSPSGRVPNLHKPKLIYADNDFRFSDE